MRAIVLSGGGARGSYQIGVWKALRKLRIKYQIVTGTSVGAFNGALMVQKDYFSAKRIWENMDYKFVFDSKVNIDDFVESIKIYAKELFGGGGFSVNNLEKNIEKYLKIKRFYRSKIKYGLVTFNSTTMKEKCLTKEDIPKEKLADYLMASATPFPVFRPKKIDEENFIDGGFYDVLPINLAVDLGATEIIAIDLKSWGFRKKLKDKSVKVTFIKPRNKLNMFLRFESDVAKRQIRLGYNDVMKKHDKLYGDKYTFKKWGFKKNINKFSVCNKELTEKEKVNVIENCGEIFNLDDSLIYNIKDFNEKISHCIDEIKIVDLKKYDLKDIKLKKIQKQVVKYMISNYKSDVALKIGRLFKKEKLCAEYLRCIGKR